MATRSTIKIEGNTTSKIYKHFDGYPEAMLPMLQKFNKKFKNLDESYKSAQVLMYMAVNSEESGFDAKSGRGFGIVTFSDKCGEEYEYMLKEDGTVTYRKIY